MVEAKVAETKSRDSAAMELGRLYYERCDFDVAIEKLSEASDGFFKDKRFEDYLKCQSYLLRMYAEREDVENVRSTKERLQDLVLKEGFELSAKIYYTLGICASYKGQHDLALEYFQKSLAMALSTDHKQDICEAINGLAISYYNLDRLQEALKEVYNLQVFFQVMEFTDVKLSSKILNAHILRKMKNYEQALDIFWECYDLLRVEKNMYIYLSLLYSMALTYREAGEADMARVYLKLAKRSIDPNNLRFLSRHVDGQLEELGVRAVDEYDLIFNPSANAVTEKKKGRVDFRNQFILLDMLRLFMHQPGAVFSKENLVRQVWKQEYNPAVHDNKIYVTIKRLRKLIEPDYDKPKYIFRAKNGYYLNRNTKILVERH